MKESSVLPHGEADIGSTVRHVVQPIARQLHLLLKIYTAITEPVNIHPASPSH